MCRRRSPRGGVAFRTFIHERFRLDEKIVTIYKKDALERFNDELYKSQISMFDQIIDADTGPAAVAGEGDAT